MEKFNVGDRVKLIKQFEYEKEVGLKKGFVGTVVSVLLLSDTYGIKFDNWHNGLGEDESIWWVYGYMLEKVVNEDTKVVDRSNYGKLKFGDVCRVGFGGDLRGYQVNDLVEVVELRVWENAQIVSVRPYGYHPIKKENDKDWFAEYELIFVSRDNKKNFLDEQAISRKDLEKRLGKSNRLMRKEVAKLAEKIGVISLSKVGGYRLVNKLLTTSEDIAKEMEVVQHQINEHQSRIEHLNMRTSRLIADLKVLQEQQMNLVGKGK